MEQAEKLTQLDGMSKKNTVLTYMKLNLTHYDKYEEIIVAIIEVVIVLSKTKVLINLKHSLCKYYKHVS